MENPHTPPGGSPFLARISSGVRSIFRGGATSVSNPRLAPIPDTEESDEDRYEDPLDLPLPSHPATPPRRPIFEWRDEPARDPPVPVLDVEDPNAVNAGILFALQAITRTLSTPKSNTPHLKTKEPDVFTGKDPSKLRDFLMSVTINLASRQGYTEAQKIMYIMSYLRDDARSLFQPDLADGRINPDAAWTSSFDAFVDELTRNFGPADPQGDAIFELSQLTMRENHHISRYTIQFSLLASRTGYNDIALRSQYYKGLPSRLKDKLSESDPAITLLELRDKATRIDTRYWQRKKESEMEAKSSFTPKSNATPSKTDNSQSTSTNNSNRTNNSWSNQKKPDATASAASKDQTPRSASSAPPKAHAKHLDSNGKLKPEEKERRRREGLCLRCGGNHMADKCDLGKSISGKASIVDADPAGASGSGSGKA